MKKYLICIGLMLLVSIANAQWFVPWYAQNPTFNNITASGYITVGTALTVGNGQNLLGKTTFNYNYSSASSDEDVSFSFISTGTAIGNSGKVSGLRSEYNWYGGDNATFTGEGVEGVVRSRASDENMTGRGVSGRIYAGTGYTMKTGIGGEFAYRIEDNNHPAYGSSYSAIRGWCYPGWEAVASSNVVNNYGLWLYNEHATNAVTNAIKVDYVTSGAGYTNDISLQNGETIDNTVDNTIKLNANTVYIATNTLVGKNLNCNTLTVGGTAYFTNTNFFTCIGSSYTMISGSGTGAGFAPLQVNNAFTYLSPYTQYLQDWRSNGKVVATLRADGTLDLTQGNAVGNDGALTANQVTNAGGASVLDMVNNVLYIRGGSARNISDNDTLKRIIISTDTAIQGNVYIGLDATKSTWTATGLALNGDITVSSRPMAGMAWHLNASSLTVINVASTYELICGTAALDTNSAWFEAVVDANGNPNRLTYKGANTHKFRWAVSGCVRIAAPTTVEVRLFKGGVQVGIYETSVTGTNTVDDVSISLEGLVSLAATEYLEVKMATTDGDDISIDHLQLTVTPIN